MFCLNPLTIHAFIQNHEHIWASPWDYSTYHIGDQRSLRVRPKIRQLAPLDGCTCAFEEWVYGRKVPKSHELAHIITFFGSKTVRPSQGWYLVPCSPEINHLVFHSHNFDFQCSLFPKIVIIPLIFKYYLPLGYYISRINRIWYLSPMWASKVQESLCIRAVSPEPPLLAHTSGESRGTFRQKARSLAPYPPMSGVRNDNIHHLPGPSEWLGMRS